MSERARLLITRHLPEAVQERARRDYDVVQLQEDRVPEGDEIIRLAEGCSGIVCCITEKFTAGVIDRLPESVKVLSTFSVGTDHIDLAAARERGLLVGCAPNGVTRSTAEIAMTLLLAAAHRAYEGEAMVRTGAWDGWAPQQLLGRRLYQKRIGIFGMGKIGRTVAQMARGFDMTIHYHNRSRLSEDMEQGACYHETLEGLLAVSDVLSIHAPATSETRHIINREMLGKLPEGVIVINTARGDLVKDEDLIAALQSGQVFAAGLDVFEGEPAIHPGYRELSNVFLLPHLGSATIEARIEMGFEALDNIDAVLSGKGPAFPV